MTKQDLIAAAAQSAGVTKKAAADVLEAVLGTITKSLKKGENVTSVELHSNIIELSLELMTTYLKQKEDLQRTCKENEERMRVIYDQACKLSE